MTMASLLPVLGPFGMIDPVRDLMIHDKVPTATKGRKMVNIPESQGIETFLCAGKMSTAVRLAYGLGPLIQVLEERGLDVDPILEVAEIPRFALEEPTYPIRLDQEVKFTRLALTRLDLANPGLVVGGKYHITMFGVLGLAGLSARNAGELIATVLSYPVLAWGMFDTSAWRTVDHSILRFEKSVDTGECGPFFAERDMTCAVTAFRDALGEPVVPELVRFAHKAPKDASSYSVFFGCDVRFGESANEILFNAAFWDKPLPQADPMAKRFYERLCRRVSETLIEPVDYADIVRSRLTAAVPIPTLGDLAERLHLTERTLQRRLSAEGTRFSTILQEVRLARAREYLRRNDLSIEEIAGRLGFADAVAFSHAFKDWTGKSPSAYRNAC